MKIKTFKSEKDISKKTVVKDEDDKSSSRPQPDAEVEGTKRTELDAVVTEAEQQEQKPAPVTSSSTSAATAALAKRTTGEKLDDAKLRYLMRKQQVKAAIAPAPAQAVLLGED